MEVRNTERGQGFGSGLKKINELGLKYKIASIGRLGGSVSEASAFGPGHDPRVLGLSPTSGSLLLPLPAAPPACALSL